jgi:hypothetical protein
MITDNDIKKLKKALREDDVRDDVRAIRKDLKNLARNTDKKFATKDELDEKLQRFTDNIVKEMFEMFTPIYERMDNYIAEQRGQRIAIGDHESRLQDVEKKIFPQV